MEVEWGGGGVEEGSPNFFFQSSLLFEFLVWNSDKNYSGI